MASTVTRFEQGTNGIDSNQFNGVTIDDVFNDPVIPEVLSLNGNESVQVRSAGSSSFTSQNRNYVIRQGDTVSFNRSSGTKG